MAEEENSNIISASGFIVIFSFISVMFIFFAMILIGGFNNYIIYDLLRIVETFISNGLMPSFLSETAIETAETLIDIIPFLDILWVGAFISMVISTLVFSYTRKRENYFTLFTMSVLGLIIIIYVGSIIIQLTQWFNTEILLAVFPNLVELAPKFTWYLDNIGIINLILICLNILANFLDLDFSKFNRRKEGENLDEI